MAIGTCYSVETRSGKVAVWDTDKDGLKPVALFMHGFCSCKEVFQKQMEGLQEQFRCIAIDLPGLGVSDNAKTPEVAYSVSGYAEAVREVLGNLNIQKATIIGWDLGGHVAIELLRRWPGGVQGTFLTGTSPIPLTFFSLHDGYNKLPPDIVSSLATTQPFTSEQAQAFVLWQTARQEQVDATLVTAAKRTDANVRAVFALNFLPHPLFWPCLWLVINNESSRLCLPIPYLMKWFERVRGRDQQITLQHSHTPFAMVFGNQDSVVKLDYIRERFLTQWPDRVHFLEGGGHAVFWHDPENFNAILRRFLEDVNRRKEKGSPQAAPKQRVWQRYALAGATAIAAVATSFFFRQ
jgi:pimeloyl-ACP methyl ester carboxylesterase